MIRFRRLIKGMTALATAMIVAMTPLTGVQAAVTPEQAIAVGIDVSKYQGLIDWAQVKASGVSFAFVKIGSSKGMDPYADYNIKADLMNGIQTGVYVYSYATTPEEAANEAALTIAWLQNYNISFPVVIDIEDKVHKGLSMAQQQQVVMTFCAMIDAAGYYPMVYSSKNWYLTRLGDVPYDKWVAQYSTVCDYPGAVCVWQKADTARIPGIAGNVDIDYLYKDYSNLIIPEGFINHYNYIRYYRNYKMQTGWIAVNGLKYHMDALGHMQFGWFSDESGTYYLAEDGHAVTGQNKVGAFDFYFDEHGRMQTGWVNIAGVKYFYDPATGAMVKGWLPTPNGNFFFDMTTGAMSIGAVNIGENSYFFDANGLMYTGLLDVGGVKFYYDTTSGAMVKNAFATNGIGIAYFAEDGHMVTGLTTIGKDMYLFDAAGTLLPNTYLPFEGGTIVTDEMGKVIFIG